jgi:hypothetical protein
MSDQISLLDGDRFAPGADLLDVDSCQRKWMVEPGEVFTFDGRTAGHVLICGDARSRAVADLAVRLVGRTRRRIAIIDPPYGIKYRSSSKERLSDTGKPLVSRRVDADFGADEFDTSWMPTWKAAADPKAVYLFSGWTISARWREAMTAAGWPPKARIIWTRCAERRKINLITRSKDPTCVHSSPAP